MKEAVFTESDSNVKVKTSKKWLLPYILVTSLFFFWGFVHNLDPILIPHLRKAFNLTDFESSLVDSSVFIAYFAMALPAGYIMRKYGYKSGILVGLLFSGLVLFYLFPQQTHSNTVIFWEHYLSLPAD